MYHVELCSALHGSLDGRGVGGECTRVCAWLSRSAVRLKLSHYYWLYAIKGFPGGSDGKESACSAGDLGSIPELGRSPGGVYGNLLQFSCLDNPQGQKSLAGYSPWAYTESDMTE